MEGLYQIIVNQYKSRRGSKFLYFWTKYMDRGELKEVGEYR